MSLRDGTMMFFHNGVGCDMQKTSDNRWYTTVEVNKRIQQTEAHPTREMAEDEARDIIENSIYWER